jgi:hypothetical protein
VIGKIRQTALGRLSALLAICVALGVLSAPAPAFQGRALQAKFTEEPFSHVSGLAVDQASQNVFVADGQANNVIDIFGPLGGSRIGQVTGAEAPSGTLAFNQEHTGISIDNACFLHAPKLSGAACTTFDPSNGSLYVPAVQASPNAVDKFTPTGATTYAYQCQFTNYGPYGAGTACLKEQEEANWVFSEPLASAVDGSGNVFLGTYNPRPLSEKILEYDSGGHEVKAITLTLSPTVPSQYLVADLKGDLYRETYGGGEVIEIESGGGEQLIAQNATGIAFDPVTKRLLIDLGSHVEELNEAHEVVGAFGSSAGASLRSVAANDTTEEAYALDQSTDTVDRFGPTFLLPDASTGGASEIKRTSATVAGSVNPLGTATSYYFQYGETAGVYGSSTPVVKAGEGKGAVPVSVGLTELRPATTYHYRLVAENANGVNYYAGDREFSTPFVAPSIDGPGSSSHITVDEAVLEAKVNPNNASTKYSFEYAKGEEPFTHTTPPGSAGAGFGDVTAEARIVELEPSTTYRYRITATSQYGTSVGGEGTLITAAPTPPEVTTGAASNVSQNGATVSGEVNARGLATHYSVQVGTDTNYGSTIYGDAGTDVAGRTLQAILVGLMPGTTYHYRFLATNADGTTYGADASFTTTGSQAPTLALPAIPPLLPVPTIASLEGCSSTLSLASHSIKRGNLTLLVYVPSAGTLAVSGKGLSRATASSTGCATLRLTLRERRARKLSTTVKLSFVSEAGVRFSLKLRVKFKRASASKQRSK